CPAQSYAYGYTPSNNTALGFSLDANLGAISVNAMAPAGYTRTANLLSGSILAPLQYQTYTELSAYNVTACANYCNNWGGCAAFNIYFERLPSQIPGPSCPNPAASVAVKCALYSSTVTASQANNFGEFRSQFIDLITGSNVYTKNPQPAAIAGYTATALAGFVNVDTSLQSGQAFYQGSSFDASLCTALCDATNTANYNAAFAAGQTTYTPCNYADAAWISVQGQGYGTYCGLFT
ncbi:hypothetical protein K461DRAFT_205335, partial [Myriangium duriaei CBS 260.36]